jgi:hypothetical protein
MCLAHIVCTFRNISFTIAKRRQLANDLNWMNCSPMNGCAEVGKCEMLTVTELDDNQLLIPITGLGVEIYFSDNIEVFK